MRFKHKRIFISGVALTIAGVLGVGALLETSVSVQASSVMMPGIEQIVEKVSEDKPFRILEIVDSKADAEIGYYVSGQEPYIKLYEYEIKDENGNVIDTIHFSSLEEGLSKLPTEQLRREFAANQKFDEQGNPIESGLKDISDVCYKGDPDSDSMDYPLSYAEYEEKYFMDEGDSLEDGWKQIDFVDKDGKSRIDTVSLEGSYVENPSGNGNYTKQEQSYYPIRSGSQDDANDAAKFRENIQNFFLSEGDDTRAPYNLKFVEVDNETVNSVLDNTYTGGQNPILQEYDYAQGRYGYYENVYADLTTELENSRFSFPGEENAKEGEGILIQKNDNLAVTEIFGSGDEQLFDSLESVPEEEIFGAGTAGDITDHSDEGDVFSDNVFTSDMAEDNEPIDNNRTVGDTAFSNGSADNGESDSSNNEPKILGDILDKDTVGSQSNPYVYRGEAIVEYPNYKYTIVGDLNYVKKQADDNIKRDEEKIEKNEPISRSKGDITLENGQYWYWEDFEGNVVKQSLSIVTGRQPVAYNYIRPISQELDYNYYYRVEEAYFCCKLPENGNSESPQSYQYYGWYFPSYPQNEPVYLPVTEGEVATHYISDAEYKLTPGNGNYDFIPGEGEVYDVEVNHAYYRGGYENNDWLKRYVFHLSPTPQKTESNSINTDTIMTEEEAKQQFDNFAIEVNTFMAEQLPNMINASSDETSEAVPVLSENESGDQNGNQEQDKILTSDEDQVQDEDQSLADEEEKSDTNAEEVTVFEDGEVSQVEPIISEVMEELVGPEADQLFSDSSDQTQSEQMQTEQEPYTDSLFSDPEMSDAEEVFSSEEEINFTSGNEVDNNKEFQLSNYDLIYINSGTISKDVATVIAASRIPCIINQEKVIDSETKDIEGAFSDFWHQDDKDKHYVDQYVYFFRNVDEDGNVSASGLVNMDFGTPFYSQSEVSDGDTPEILQGFEEIKEYIDSENQYRGLEPGTEPLSYDISQARAIEYILNYNLKRKTKFKKEISVLEIQPASGNYVLTQEEVLDWLGEDGKLKIFDRCCAEDKKADKPAENIIDNNADTFWHSKYSEKVPSHPLYHNFTIELPNSLAGLSGIYYIPRQDNNWNGTAKKIRLDFYNRNNKLISSIEKDLTYKDKYKDKQTVEFEEPITGAKYITVTFLETYGDTENLASCAEFGIIRESANVKITHMTASEFVGHIEDLNSNYDLIYIGDGDKERDNLINGDNKLLYAHIGGVSLNSRTDIKGMMDSDYGEVTVKDVNGKDILETRIKSGASNLRGSGNDITLEKKKALLEFVKSGYPVLIGNNLMKKTDEGYQIDTNLVDTSSYYYQFIDETKDYQNVMNLREAKENVGFYLELPKPEIVLTQQPPSVVGGGVERLTNQNLTYEFHIESRAEPLPESARYHCRLYIDLNNDGVYSNLEDQSYYVEIKDKENGIILPDSDGRYHLKLDTEYVLTRRVPTDYYKLIPWKLQVENEENSFIRSSVIGYTKRSPQSKQEIKVLQIGATKYDLVSTLKENWNLEKSKEFNKLMEQEDFDIKITYRDVKNFETQYEDSWRIENKNYLDGFDMIIIGFRDVYDNIPDNSVKVGEETKPSPAEAILQFIEDGKSVIFSHDTTSFVNRDRRIYGDLDTKNKEIPDISWEGDKTRGLDDWGYSLNSKLRTAVGMDRYGIVSNKQFKGTPVKDILKKGLTLPIADDDIDKGSKVSISDINNLVGDMAFEPNRTQEKTVAEVQGFTNHVVKSGNSNIKTTSKVTKVNEGAITIYPYEIPPLFQCAQTHSQYYQLALEENSNDDGVNDIVVWYCLAAGENNTYGKSPNDVRNNYYFYSKGNVIYTGVGHSSVDGADNEFEKKLFVNAIVAAASVTAVQPQVEFIKSFYPGSERELYRYYMTDYHLLSNKDSGNILDNEQMFNFSVRDYNMVAASLDSNSNIGKMKVELYIENEHGEIEDEKIGKGIKLSQITGVPLFKYNGTGNPTKIDPSKGGVYELSENGTYQFTVSDLEKFLWDSQNGFKDNVKIYVKVSNTVKLYGKDVQKVSVDSIVLKQRQLFDLD